LSRSLAPVREAGERRHNERLRTDRRQSHPMRPRFIGTLPDRRLENAKKHGGMIAEEIRRVFAIRGRFNSFTATNLGSPCDS